ncbi:carbonic anhydrase [Lignipirellula cremea]|uniref:carbonic anhydrase n=1 Tax=Lignipirellula cremea TaxID=2528010 RepID=A0A518E3J9_9BACT|nr:carbonic anhydrase family protein [Lignipirellula cremea]QDU98670.1 Carbonic anhydrase precursor [Lignipirellula cremea]
MNRYDSRTVFSSSLLLCLALGCSQPAAPDKTASAKPDKTASTEPDKSASTSDADVPVHHYFLKEETPPLAAWSYKGATGPAHWGSLNPAYRMAADGKQQSPIDIELPQVEPKQLPELRFDYNPETVAAMNNGHTIEHNSDESGSKLHIGDQSYQLEQFHVHTPSEHLINGKHADMEVHFVHKSAQGEVAVVAVMVNKGEHDPIQIPTYSLPSKTDELVVSYRGVHNPIDFLPKERSYLAYRGSFTTPPCTEDVRWIVLSTPVEAKPELIDQFAAILKGNNRPVQPLNGRQVSEEKQP